MKCWVPRCRYKRAEGWSWMALVRSLTASLMRPRGDRIYGPKCAVRKEDFQRPPPKLLMFSVTHRHAPLSITLSTDQSPWPRVQSSEVRGQQAEKPLLCPVKGEAEELRSNCLVTTPHSGLSLMLLFLKCDHFFPQPIVSLSGQKLACQTQSERTLGTTERQTVLDTDRAPHGL